MLVNIHAACIYTRCVCICLYTYRFQFRRGPPEIEVFRIAAINGASDSSGNGRKPLGSRKHLSLPSMALTALC